MKAPCQEPGVCKKRKVRIKIGDSERMPILVLHSLLPYPYVAC